MVRLTDRPDMTIDVYRGVHIRPGGWSGGAMVLGKLSKPGRPTNLD